MLETPTAHPVPAPHAAYADTAFSNGYEFTEGTGYTLPEYPFVAPPELATGEVRRYPIVIVGGGITGLTLACALAQHGVAAVLLDEDNTVGVKGASSRGICYAQKTLEIFKRLGVYERIARKGVQWSVGRTFAGEDEVYSFDLRQQQTHSLSRQPPFINIQQFYIEGFLVEQLLAAPAAQGRVDLRCPCGGLDSSSLALGRLDHRIHTPVDPSELPTRWSSRASPRRARVETTAATHRPTLHQQRSRLVQRW